MTRLVPPLVHSLLLSLATHNEQRYLPPRVRLRDNATYTTSLSGLPLVSTSDNGSATSRSMGEVEWLHQSDFEVVSYIGEGRFSHVFAAHRVSTHSRVVLKVLKQTYTGKIKREINVLCRLRNEPNIIQLIGIVKVRSIKTFALVLEYLGSNSSSLSAHANLLTSDEVRWYMRKLLLGLNTSHTCGIMHRDIKPGNILINRVTKELRILDWGLSDAFVLGKQFNPSVCSRHYKSPELLMSYLYYDFAIDVWSAGCVFAELLFKREPLMQCDDKYDHMARLASLLGSDTIRAWATEYCIRLSVKMNRAIGNYTGRSLTALSTNDNQRLAQDDALDLLARMLEVDHRRRLTADECLRHPYFSSVLNSEDFDA